MLRRPQGGVTTMGEPRQIRDCFCYSYIAKMTDTLYSKAFPIENVAQLIPDGLGKVCWITDGKENNHDLIPRRFVDD